MNETLKIFWSFLVANGYPQPALIEKGLNPDIVVSRLKEVMANPPKELIDWYAWQNGYTWDGPKFDETFLIEHGYPIPLDDAIQYYQNAPPNEFESHETMFPILTGGIGPTYYYNFDTSATTKIYLSFPELTPVFSSLQQLLISSKEAFSKKIYWYSEGRLRRDVEKRFKLFEQLNPEIEYWKNLPPKKDTGVWLINLEEGTMEYKEIEE